MKILVLGSTGMLGHQLVKSLSVNHSVDFCVRGSYDFTDFIRVFTPEVVINCVGVVKQHEVPAEEMIEINSVLPHKLAGAANEVGARFIHFSTDCVFSGRQGPYSEERNPRPTDLYGQSKLLGEYDLDGVVLRTSFVGRSPYNGRGLVEWFLGCDQSKQPPGYTNWLFSGLTTIELSRAVERVLASDCSGGLWHVAGPAISKYELLRLVAKYYGRRNPYPSDIQEPCCRVLEGKQFNRYFGYTPPTWDDMIKEMANAER